MRPGRTSGVKVVQAGVAWLDGVARSRRDGRVSSAVPDVLAPACSWCSAGSTLARSAAAGAHFANPRNYFWRFLHDAGFTPRLYAPAEQHALLAGLD